ncbi:MAG: hypothetical protein ACFB10_21650 [Salibacteraceae bacterium]
MKTTVIALTFIWVGMVLAISFLEAPLKFQAPNITTELGLGIGRIVFTALNTVELVIAAVIAIGLFRNTRPLTEHWPYAIPLSILFVQSVWLLPALTRRLDLILAGETLPSSYHHVLFIVLEVSKVVGLLVAGVRFSKS